MAADQIDVLLLTQGMIFDMLQALAPFWQAPIPGL